MGAQRSEIEIELAWIALFEALKSAVPPKRRGHRRGGKLNIVNPVTSVGVPRTFDSVERYLENHDLHQAGRVAGIGGGNHTAS